MKSEKCKAGCDYFVCAGLVFALALTACGGGNGDGSNTPTPAAGPANVESDPAPSTDISGGVPGSGSGVNPGAGGGNVPGSDPNTQTQPTSLNRGYVVISRDEGQSYRALDLANFSTVEGLAVGTQDRASVGMATLIHQGTFDANVRALTDFRPTALFYVEAGRFWVMPLNGSATDLVPRQVSSESATDICAINPQTSITDPSDGFIFVELAGPDTDCLEVGDNKRGAIKLQFDATTPARDLTAVLSDVNTVRAYEDYTNGGKIAGYVGRNKLTLMRLNSDLGAPVPVFTASQSLNVNHHTGDLQVSALNDRSFFVGDHNLLQYQFETQQVSQPLFDFGRSKDLSDFFACDAQDCFFIHKTDLINAVLLRIPADASAIAQPLTNLNSTDGTVIPSTMILTRSYVYYVKAPFAGETQRLMRVAKSGGTPQEIDSAASLVNGVGIRASNLDHVFYVKHDLVTGNTIGGTALIRREDGTLVFESTASTFVGLAVQSVDFVNHSIAGAVLMVSGMPAPTTKFGGGTLRAVTSGNPAMSLALGTVPDYVRSLVAFGMGTAVPINAIAAEPLGRLIAFAAKTDGANSLTQISSQPGPNETFFPF